MNNIPSAGTSVLRTAGSCAMTCAALRTMRAAATSAACSACSSVTYSSVSKTVRKPLGNR
jgi:hypothetical protein